MPTLNGPIQIEGALVDVQISWSAAQAAQLRAALRAVPPPAAVRAAIDTGAETSCIDSNLVRTLGLAASSIVLTNVPAVGGLFPGVQHAVGLRILHPSGNASADLDVPNLLVVELPLNTLGYHALIGRDLLTRCEFVYNGPTGVFSLTY